MRRFFVRSAGAVALVSALGLGTVTAFAAETPGGAADTPDALPAGAISAAVAQQDALAKYPGGTAVADGVNDQNGIITYGYQVTQNGATYDVQVNALTGAILQVDAGGPDTGTATEAKSASDGERAGAAGLDVPGGANIQQDGNF